MSETTSPYLKKTKYNKALKLSNSRFVHDYYELVSELRLMGDSEFFSDVNKVRNKIADWIDENYHDKVLVSSLRSAGSRLRYASMIEKRIKEIERESQSQGCVADNARLRTFYWRAVSPYIVLVFLLGLLSVYLFVNFSGEKNRGVELLKEAYANTSHEYVRDLICEKRILELEEKNRKLEVDADSAREYMSSLNGSSIGPKDRIGEGKIELRNTSVVIYVNNPILSRFSGSGSMLPVLSSTANAIEVIPKSPNDIAVGDIIGFISGTNESIVHRVIEVGSDEEGWYAVTKGDNSPKRDPGKVRFSKIERVVVAIVY